VYRYRELVAVHERQTISIQAFLPNESGATGKELVLTIFAHIDSKQDFMKKT
jgi:hypothetical protein